MSFEYSGDDVEPIYRMGHLFFIRVPELDDYLYKLFSTRYHVDQDYPLWIFPDEDILDEIRVSLKKNGVKNDRGRLIIENEGQLLKALQEIFASNRTREIITSLAKKVLI